MARQSAIASAGHARTHAHTDRRTTQTHSAFVAHWTSGGDVKKFYVFNI